MGDNFTEYPLVRFKSQQLSRQFSHVQSTCDLCGFAMFCFPILAHLFPCGKLFFLVVVTMWCCPRMQGVAGCCSVVLGVLDAGPQQRMLSLRWKRARRRDFRTLQGLRGVLLIPRSAKSARSGSITNFHENASIREYTRVEECWRMLKSSASFSKTLAPVVLSLCHARAVTGNARCTLMASH